MALAPDYDPLADAMRANDPPPNVTATLPADYDPLADAEQRQSSPLKVPYQNGKPMDQGGLVSNTFDAILGLGKGVDAAVDRAAWGTLRGLRDAVDTGAHGLASTARAVLPDGWGPDVEAMRAADKATRDAWQAKNNDLASGVGRLGGQIYSTALPVGAIGRGLAAGASMLPGAIGRAAQYLTSAIPAARAPGRAGQLALQGAGTGAVQSGLTSSASDLPLDEQMVEGGLTGALAGPAIGGLTRGVDMLRGYVGGVRPEVAALADVARQYGVTPPVTSLTTNPFLRQVSDALQKLPFSGADAGALAKQRQFQTALTREMGSTADNLSPATMKETADRLSDRYERLYANAPPITSGTPSTPGGPTPLVTDLANVGTDAGQYLVGDQKGAMEHVGNAIRQVSDAFAGGSLDPRAYKSLMGANDGTLARIEEVAPSAAQPYLEKIRNLVKGRFAASAGPDAAAELKDIDRQWRVMKTVDPLSAASTLGDIGPGGVLQRVIDVSKRYDGSTGGVAYTGGGPLGDLGRVGKQFFGAIPDSGTAGRMQAYDLAKNPFGTVGMMPFGATLGRGMQAWSNSPRVAGRVIDTGLGGPRPDTGRLLPYGLLGPINSYRE
jgi:hypothetical protein